MNGPEHYRAAEALLEQAVTGADASLLTRGQAHATLALTAATAAAVPAACQHPSWQDALVSDIDRGRQEHPDAKSSERPF